MTTIRTLMAGVALAALTGAAAFAQTAAPDATAPMTPMAQQGTAATGGDTAQAQTDSKPLPKGADTSVAQSATPNATQGTTPMPRQDTAQAQTDGKPMTGGTDTSVAQTSTPDATKGMDGAKTQDTAQAPAQPGTPGATDGTDTSVAQNKADGSADKTPQITEAALEVENQQAKDGMVTIDMAWMPEAGFVALHPVVDGQLSPDAVGHAVLAKGDNEAVSIKLDNDITEATHVVAMLHRDTGTLGTYEFGKDKMDVDAPEAVGGRLIAAMFTIAPQQVTPSGDSAAPATPAPANNG